MSDDRWARQMYKYIHLRSYNTKWATRTKVLTEWFGVETTRLTAVPQAGQRHKVREHVRAAELERWRTSTKTKLALSVYRTNKQAVGPERFYDNIRGSSLLSEAHGWVLRTRAMQAKFTLSMPTTCHRCNAAEETIQNAVLVCVGLQPGPPLEQPLGQTNPSYSSAFATALGFCEQGAPPNWKKIEFNEAMGGALVVHQKSARCPRKSGN
ncbi:hypothetical protein MRX96_054327 [Rhipicephalus microplus]